MDNRSIKKIKEILLEIDGISVLKIITENALKCLNETFQACNIFIPDLDEDLEGFILTNRQYKEIIDCVRSSTSAQNAVEIIKLLKESEQVFTVYVITQSGLSFLNNNPIHPYEQQFQNMVEDLAEKMGRNPRIVLTESQLLETISPVTDAMRRREEPIFDLINRIMGPLDQQGQQGRIIRDFISTGKVVDSNGTIKTYFQGKLHSYNDEPAVIRKDGMKLWYKNGKLHSYNDKPAVVQKDGKKFWYKNGKPYRDNDKPNVMLINGTQMWYNEDGKLHRDNDEPAVIFPNNDSRWYKNGKLHRDNGPAIEEDDVEEWYQNGKLHRDNGPALIRPEVTEWYQNGKPHRDNGPAIIRRDGIKMWLKNGLYHRDDGPAITRPNGTGEWIQNGKHVKTITN